MLLLPSSDVDDDAEEPMLEEEPEDDSFDKGDDADSDADTDIVEDYGPSDKEDKGLPEGATRLSLTRHVSQMGNERGCFCCSFLYSFLLLLSLLFTYFVRF